MVLIRRLLNFVEGSALLTWGVVSLSRLCLNRILLPISLAAACPWSGVVWQSVSLKRCGFSLFGSGAEGAAGRDALRRAQGGVPPASERRGYTFEGFEDFQGAV